MQTCLSLFFRFYSFYCDFSPEPILISFYICLYSYNSGFLMNFTLKCLLTILTSPENGLLFKELKRYRLSLVCVDLHLPLDLHQLCDGG